MGTSVPKNTTQTTITDVPGAVKPGVQWAMQGLQGLYGGEFGGDMPLYNTGFRQARDRSLLGSPVQAGANTMALQTLRGDYLDSPYLQGQFEAMARPIKEQYMEATLPQLNSQFATGGRSFSPSMAAMQGRAQDYLGRNLSEIGLGLTAENYARERGIQQDTMKYAPVMAQADYADPQMAMQLGLMRDPLYQQRESEYMNMLRAAGLAPQGGGSVSGPSGYGNNTGNALAGAATSALMTYLLSALMA